MHNQELAPETIDSRRRYLCRHIFTEGHRCGSPALRGHDFCYYHRAARQHGPLAGRIGIFTMSRIDDRAAIQIALYDILSRVTAGDIDLKLASTVLYGLQIASSNLPRAASSEAAQPAFPQPLVEEITHDYHLGDLAPVAELPAIPAAQEFIATEIVTAEFIAAELVTTAIDPPALPCVPTQTGCLPAGGLGGIADEATQE
jgi:hypothetical protein